VIKVVWKYLLGRGVNI